MDDGQAIRGTTDPLVPLGAAYFPVQQGAPTRSFAFVLVEGFTLLAFSSADEPLRIANQLSQQPLYSWQVLSRDGGPVASSSGIAVCTDAALVALPRDTRLFVCAGKAPPRQMAASARSARICQVNG